MASLGADGVDRAFAMILADDRRALSAEDDLSAKRLWRSVFRHTPDSELLEAVSRWLQQNPKGRPNVGKIKELFRKKAPPTGQEQRPSEDESTLRWAVSIAENPGPWVGPYAHTLVMAEHVLRKRGFAHWHDAKGYLEPGWTPGATVEWIP